MIENPRKGLMVRLEGSPGQLGAYLGLTVTLESPVKSMNGDSNGAAWYFTVEPVHPLYADGPKWCATKLMHPVVKPPTFTSPAEAQAWLDANGGAS